MAKDKRLDKVFIALHQQYISNRFNYLGAMTIILLMSQDHRSRSAQDRSQGLIRNDLRKRLNYVCHGDKAAMGKHQLKQANNIKYVPIHMHPDIERVESYEKIGMANNKSAIHELQDLITPSSIDHKREEGRITKQGRNSNQQYYTSYENPVNKAKDFMNKIHNKSDRPIEYYKAQNGQLKVQLQSQKSKNQELLAQINKLSSANRQLEKEKTRLIERQHKNPSNDQSNKIKQLEKDVKYQLIVNLELEELMLKQKLHKERNEGIKHHDQEAEYLRRELSQLKQAYNDLQQQLIQKDIEIQSLKQSLRIKSEQMAQSPPSSYPELQSPTFAALTPQKIQSTSPSLENTKGEGTTDCKTSNDRLGDHYLSLMFANSSSGKPSVKTYRL